jgi:anaerobic magnesium-protoporphyrin IX monomethyl ester cyclase
MKALLVYSLECAYTVKRPLISPLFMHMGLSYVAGCLKDDGHDVSLVVLSSRHEAQSAEIALEALRREGPDMVAFTAVSTQYPFLCRIAARMKQACPEAFLILGGSHASLNPGAAIEGPFDALCIGEGEQACVEAARELSAGRRPRAIPNLWIRQPDGTVTREATRPFIQDLDALPFPDHAMWDPWIHETAMPQRPVLVARGCPFDCTYCSNHALRKLAEGRYVRHRSTASILAEIQHLVDGYGIPDIHLEAETVFSSRKWLTALCEGLSAWNAERSSPVRFTCNYRVKNSPRIDEKVFEALARANVTSLSIGLESGSHRIREEVLNRRYTNEQFLQTVAVARKHGIGVNVYNMIGLPTETPREHLETVEVNRRANPNRVMPSIFFPYPGTKLHDRCVSEGLIDGNVDCPDERRRAVLDLPGFSARLVERAFVLFDYRVYRGNRSWPFRARRLLRNYITVHRSLDGLFLKLLPLWHAVRRWMGIRFKY